MRAEITRHALNRVPLSLIIDDSTVLVDLNYFWMRDRNPVDGLGRRWEDVPSPTPNGSPAAPPSGVWTTRCAANSVWFLARRG